MSTSASMCFCFQETICFLLMAAENNTAGHSGLSFSPSSAEGHSEPSNAASQLSSPVLLTGASVNQSYAARSPLTPLLGGASIPVLPTVRATVKHPLTVCVASSVGTAASFPSYTHRVRPVGPGNQQMQGSVCLSAVAQPQNIATRVAPVPPAMQQAAQQPTAVLDLSNNGIVNAVLGRVPMVVHSLDPGSLTQKNIVAMIDSRTATAATDAPAPVSLVNFPPVLPMSYRGSVILPAPGHKVTQPGPRHSLQPVVVSQIGSRQPLVASASLAANQYVAFSQSPVGVTNTCPPRPSGVMRPTVTVRTLASSGDPTRVILSMSSPRAEAFPRLLNSTEVIPRIKLPHVASSLPGAVVRHYATAAASQTQPTNIPLAVQTKPVSALPISVCRNAANGSVIDTTSVASSALASSDSLTTILPLQSLAMKPIELFQSYVNASCPAAMLSAQSPQVASSSLVAGDRTSTTPLATSLIPMSAPTNLVSNSSPSVFSARHSLASYVPVSVPVSASIVQQFSIPSALSNQGQVGCLTKARKSPAKRPPRKRMAAASAVCSPVLGDGMNTNQAKMVHKVFHTSPVSTHVVSLAKSVMINPLSDAVTAVTCVSPSALVASAVSHSVLSDGTSMNQAKMLQTVFHSNPSHVVSPSKSVMIDPLSDPVTVPRATTSAPVAGVKRKCSSGQKYLLWLENGCQYSSVWFDGEGFQAKKPAISSAQSGSCCFS